MTNEIVIQPPGIARVAGAAKPTSAAAPVPVPGSLDEKRAALAALKQAHDEAEQKVKKDIAAAAENESHINRPLEDLYLRNSTRRFAHTSKI